MRSPAVVAFCGQKGGSGKTTTATAVAGELMARGHRVLFVDADPQGSGVTWVNVAKEKGHAAPELMRLGSGMHTALPAIAKDYDAVVIDCPPRHSEIQRAALMAASLAVLPCGPGAHDVWAMAETIELVKEAQRVRLGADGARKRLHAFILITRKMQSTVIGQNARRALRESGLPVFRAELNYRVAYQEAPAEGLGVAQYAPNQPAALEVVYLVDEIMEVLGHGKAPSKNHAAKAHRSRAGGALR